MTRPTPDRTHHFLLTRIAVRLEADSPVPADPWLSDRFQLFTSTCLPSVLGQSEGDFHWLLFVDRAVAAPFVDRLRAVLEAHHEVVLLDEPWGPAAVARAVAERAPHGRVITTRLDSDDAISRDFVARARTASVTATPGSFLNFLEGAQWSSGRVSTLSHPSNAFITRVEDTSAGPVETVFVAWHDRVDAHGPLVQVRGTGPMWLQVIHGGNLVNGESGWRARPTPVLDRFSVDLLADPVSGVRLGASRVLSALRIALRIASRPSRLRWLPRLLRARVGR